MYTVKSESGQELEFQNVTIARAQARSFAHQTGSATITAKGHSETWTMTKRGAAEDQSQFAVTGLTVRQQRDWLFDLLKQDDPSPVTFLVG